jgi:hypothetical protein
MMSDLWDRLGGAGGQQIMQSNKTRTRQSLPCHAEGGSLSALVARYRLRHATRARHYGEGTNPD